MAFNAHNTITKGNTIAFFVFAIHCVCLHNILFPCELEKHTPFYGNFRKFMVVLVPLVLPKKIYISNKKIMVKK